MKNDNFLNMTFSEKKPNETYSNYIEFRAWEDGDVAIGTYDKLITIRKSDFEAFLKRREEMFHVKQS